MRRLRYIPVLMALAALGGCSAMKAHKEQRAFDKRVMNQPAPDFELTAYDGGKVKLSNLKGKPVVLAFFAFR